MTLRAALAALVFAAGLAIVAYLGPLRVPRPQGQPQSAITPGPPPHEIRWDRAGRVNGQPFTYATAVTGKDPDQLIREFNADALPDRREAPSLLQGLPAGDDVKTAFRWTLDPQTGAAVPEALLLYGRSPVTTFRFRLSPHQKEAASYQPLADLEFRLGARGLGIEVALSLVDDDSSWVFLGRDPGTRIATPSFESAMEKAGWRVGARATRAGQALSCFARWNRDVCFLREPGGNVVVSSGAAGAIFGKLIAGTFPV